MVKTPEEMTCRNCQKEIRPCEIDGCVHKGFKHVSNGSHWCDYDDKSLQAEPTPPAPIAAQTEKCAVCDGVVDQTAAYQVNSGRWFHMQCAASSPLETPANFSFHLAHILDISYFNPSIETHGCMPDETGRCMVTACACRCHFTPAPADTGAAGHIFCGMCGDTGLQNGQKCPQIGCRKANKLPPFGPSTGDTPSDHIGDITEMVGKEGKVTGDTPQPQERKGAALLDWFIAGIRTYTSPDPMPFADETYELRKKIIGYIEAGQNAALGKMPDAREEKEK